MAQDQEKKRKGLKGAHHKTQGHTVPMSMVKSAVIRSHKAVAVSLKNSRREDGARSDRERKCECKNGQLDRCS